MGAQTSSPRPSPRPKEKSPSTQPEYVQGKDATESSTPPSPQHEETASYTSTQHSQEIDDAMTGTEDPMIFNPNATHYSSYFAVKAKIKLDNKLDKPVNFQPDLDPVRSDFCQMLRWYGVLEVGKFLTAPEILMEVQFASDKSLQKFLQSKRKVETAIKEIMTVRFRAANPQALNATFEASILLLLVTPHATNNTIEFTEVALANHRNCAALYMKSKVAELPIHPEGILTMVPEDVLTERDLPELMKLLFDAVDWFSLGLVLDIPHWKLQIIESDCPVAQVRRTKRLLSCVLVEWIQNHPEEATWSTLVHALSAIGMRPAARRIAHQYGVHIPDESVLDDLSSEKHEKLQQVLEEIKQLLKSTSSDQQVIQIIENAQKKKQLTLEAVGTILKDAVDKIKMLLVQKENLKRKLLKKGRQLSDVERQIRQLRQSRRQKAREIPGLEKAAATLKQEVSGLKQQLQQTEHELASAREKHSDELLEKSTQISALSQQTNELIREEQTLAANVSSKIMLIKNLESSNTTLTQLSTNLQRNLDMAQQQQQQLLFQILQQEERYKHDVSALREELQKQQKQDEQYSRTHLSHGTLKCLGHLSDNALKQLASVIEMDIESNMKGQATEQQKMSLQWQTCSDAPEDMRRGSAVSHDKMAYFNPGGSTAVYQFEEDQWTALPECPHYNSALTVINEQLTTVGGSFLGGPTNSLASLTGEDMDSKWVEHFPRMPTSRYDLAAVCRGTSLIAAGGYGGGGVLRTVEVMDTESLQWTLVNPLPHPMWRASIAVSQEKVYLLGGRDQNGRTLSVFTCSTLQTQPLDAQLEKPANQLTGWHNVADAPHYHSTAVCVGEVLLAIGGVSAAGEKTSAIAAYSPTSDSWEDIGHMTTPRWLPLVALLPSNELIVAGGFGGATEVEIGKIVA